MQRSLFDVPKATRRAARESVVTRADSDRGRVLALLVRTPGGLTDEEIQDTLGMNPNTERPRRGELVDLGKVVPSGATRKTKSGRAAAVWVVGRSL